MWKTTTVHSIHKQKDTIRVKTRGRKSVSSLAVLPITNDERPIPPRDLTKEQAHEWQSIVDAMPADHFGRETHPLLVELCATVTDSRCIADLLRQCSVSKNFERYKQLTGMRERALKTILQLSTALRLTNQARVHAENAATAVNNAPHQALMPW